MKRSLKDYRTNADHDIVDKGGQIVFCDMAYCEDIAVQIVPVSVNAPHDEFRILCAGHAEAYSIGVQHGRFHEAQRHGDVPGRDAATLIRDKDWGFKAGEVVQVDDDQFHGTGVVAADYPGAHVTRSDHVSVLLENGNIWSYPYEHVRHADKKLSRQSRLRRAAKQVRLKLSYRKLK